MTKRMAPIHAEEHNSRYLTHKLSKLPLMQRRILLRTPPNYYPRFLYKYISPDIREDRLEDYLINSLFFLSPVSAFNDPFDMAMHVVMEGTVAQKRKIFTNMLKNTRPNLTYRKREAEITKIMSDGRSELGNVREIHKRHIERLGVFCLSSNPRSILMWSHYGKHHKGIVLQFEIAVDPVNFIYAVPITYSMAYPTLNFLENRDSIITYALQKFCDWNYEKEWRILRIDGAGHYHPFAQKALTGVILGARADEEILLKLRKILTKRAELGIGTVKQYRARLHHLNYKLIIDKEVPQIS